MFAALWALVPSSVKWLILVAVISGVGIFAFNLERNAKLKAQAERDSAQAAAKIGYEAYVDLYQKREKITAVAAQRRRKINELQQAHDLAGLSNLLNNPGGVRGDLPANPQGGPEAVAGGGGAHVAGPEYQGSDGEVYR